MNRKTDESQRPYFSQSEMWTKSWFSQSGNSQRLVSTSYYTTLQCAMYSHHRKANTESCTTQHSLPLGTFLFSFSGLKQTNTGQYPCTRLSTASCSSSQIVYTYRVVTSYLTWHLILDNWNWLLVKNTMIRSKPLRHFRHDSAFWFLAPRADPMYSILRTVLEGILRRVLHVSGV